MVGVLVLGAMTSAELADAPQNIIQQTMAAQCSRCRCEIRPAITQMRERAAQARQIGAHLVVLCPSCRLTHAAEMRRQLQEN